MKKFASLWSFAFFILAASQLVSNCGMEAGQNKPVMSQSAGAPTTVTSQNSQPVSGRANGVADSANSGTAMAATSDVPQTNDAGAAGPAPNAALASAEAPEYRVAQQDILQISVFQVNDLNTAVQVNQDGTITLPLIGKVQVAGKTTAETEQIISGKLKQKYLQSPQVSVSIKTYGKRITVSGEVKGPRVIADDGNTTLTQAIANAGGLSEIGNGGRVHVARSKDQHVVDDVYNLDDIQAGKAPDPLLRGGDIVVAEQSGVKVALKDLSALLPFAVIASLM
jgi:polysaccharide biosynthesis/export protein